MKIAIVSSGDLSEMKGIMNFVHEKAKHLQRAENVSCDIYIIRNINSPFFLLLTKKISIKELFLSTINIENISDYDNVKYNNLLYRYGLFSNIIDTKLLKVPLSHYKVMKFSKVLKDYDLITSHTLSGHYLAYKIKQKYKIPFVTTWHGSDINIDPFKYPIAKKFTKSIMQAADMNFFVSKALLKASEKICKYGKKDVIYTGPSDYFYKSSLDEILKYRKDNSLGKDDIILGFIGNLIPIKNVLVIPTILAKVKSKLSSETKLTFWIAGNGCLEEPLKNSLKSHKIHHKFFGKLEPRAIPLFMSSLDILLLPSLNEGLPLVALEAKKCGIHVVASNVGGIKECVGEQNCFDLDKDFCDRMADRIIKILETQELSSPLNPIFSWESAIIKETETYKDILSKHPYIK